MADQPPLQKNEELKTESRLIHHPLIEDLVVKITRGRKTGKKYNKAEKKRIDLLLASAVKEATVLKRMPHPFVINCLIRI